MTENNINVGNGSQTGRSKNTSKSNNKRFNQIRGACEELRNNVFTVGDLKSGDKFTRTKEEIQMYIQRTFENGHDISTSLENLKLEDMEQHMPSDPVPLATGGTVTETQKIIHSKKCDAYCKREAKFKDNCYKAYSLILGQCTPTVKNKLESRRDWETLKLAQNPIDLLKAIKEISQDFVDTKYPMALSFKAMYGVLGIAQEENEGIVPYANRFKNSVDIMDTIWGPLMLTNIAEQSVGYTVGEREKFLKQASDSFLAFVFINGANKKKYGKLIDDLSNAYTLGDNKYPANVAKATELLTGYKQGGGGGNTNPAKELGDKTSFAQTGEYPKWMHDLICHNCKKKGHVERVCPTPAKDGSSNVQQDLDDGGMEDHQTQFCQVGHGVCLAALKTDLKDQALLDSQSSVDIFAT